MKRFIVLAVWTSLSLTAAAQAQPGKKPPFDLNAQVTSVN